MQKVGVMRCHPARRGGRAEEGLGKEGGFAMPSGTERLGRGAIPSGAQAGQGRGKYGKKKGLQCPPARK
eukprot:3687869-Karenia_brevis.AAC.1